MLISLKIENLILVEKAEIHFGPALNIITGETGSGKSAILTAIRLICGDRADLNLIRKGAEMAVIEAQLMGFESTDEELSLPSPEKPVHIRREIHSSGKSRCFINDQLVSLATLKKGITIERVDQSSSLKLCSLDNQRFLIDTFGGLVDEVKRFTLSRIEEKKIREELEVLYQSQHQRERELEWAEKDLSIISEIDWKEGEEEKLVEEHHYLTHAQELAEKIATISSTLSVGSEPLIPTLKRTFSLFEQCIRFDPKLLPIAEMMKNSVFELEEVSREVQSYSDRLEANPERLSLVEKRISEIESIKRRFGKTYEEVETQKQLLNGKIERFSNLDEVIEKLESSKKQSIEKNDKWEKELTQKRRDAGKEFALKVLAELKSLNISNARFELAQDEIRLLFSANPGVPPIPLENCASGGELSRVLLAIKVILSDMSSCLVFDEIDSNVGGQTATILGEKLKKISGKRQVICVTHFVQVAKCATDHFLVSKIEKNQNAQTLIEKITEKNREEEYSRMLGAVQ